LSFTTEAKVGVTVILGAIALTFMTFQVGGLTFGDEGYRVSVVFPTVLGLEQRAPVRISGVEVGKVEAIKLEKKGGALVTLLIDQEIEIPKDSAVSIASSGLLGDRFVEVLLGQDKASLADGGVLLSSANKGASMEQLTGQVSDLITRFVKVADDVGAVTTSLRGAFGTKEGEQSMKEIVENVRSLTKGIDDFVRSNQKSMGNSISNLEEFSVFLNKEGQGLLKSLTKISKKIESGEGTIGKLIYDQGAYDKLSGSLDDLGGSLKSVRAITKKVEQGEGTIGKLFADEKAYNNINTALEGVTNTLGRIQRFKTNVGFRSEYQIDSSENKGYLSLKLSPRQDKYYLVELVDDPVGKVALTTNVTTTNGTPVTKTDLETTRKLKFSAQFGKRLPNFGLRIGLVENAFGIGGDVYAQDDHIKFSVDAWDFSSDDPLSKKPHIKVSAQYEILRYIHFGVGYDQILNDGRDTLFVGAGLRFDDEDIQYLIGGLALSR
jgi:phospholipid/cholesterol/gamma-HCH transport system substrate-binding protein